MEGRIIRLNNGVKIPTIGLGTYKMKGEDAFDAVLYALRNGYRHIDTASFYENETEIGRALRDSGLAREDVFITSKVWNSEQGYDETVKAFHRSLNRLGTDYLDLYLVHWPIPGKRLETYRALEHLYKEGLCRAIGVSNFVIRHLEELVRETDVVPAVDQIECSPFLDRSDIIAHCRRLGIVTEAYSPLARGSRLSDARIVSMADRYRRSSAQIMIRWAVQKGMAVIPKSTHPERILENADVFDFEIDTDDMRMLDSLDEGLHTTYDPDMYG